MGRAAYEGIAGALPTADHPFTGIMNAARKVVFSRTLRMAEWANTPSPLVRLRPRVTGRLCGRRLSAPRARDERSTDQQQRHRVRRHR